jgi:hypothetical protein
MKRMAMRSREKSVRNFRCLAARGEPLMLPAQQLAGARIERITPNSRDSGNRVFCGYIFVFRRGA